MKIVNNIFLVACMLLIVSCASPTWETRSGNPEIIFPNNTTNEIISNEMASYGWLLINETSNSLSFEKNVRRSSTFIELSDSVVSSVGWNLSVARDESGVRVILHSIYNKYNSVAATNSSLGSNSIGSPIKTYPPNKRSAEVFYETFEKLANQTE